MTMSEDVEKNKIGLAFDIFRSKKMVREETDEKQRTQTHQPTEESLTGDILTRLYRNNEVSCGICVCGSHSVCNSHK